MSELPPMTAVRVFEAAARHLNFTAAAAELSMTQAAVSYQIRLLEERLGLQLFLRRKRGVELTEAGARLSPVATRSFNALREAFRAVRESDAQILDLTSTPTFASNFLVPRLGYFQVSHPGMAVRLDVSGELVDFETARMDAGIRVGKGQWPGLAITKLLDVNFTPVVGREVARELGDNPKPADLLDFPLIIPGDPWWHIWFEKAGVALGLQRPGLEFESQDLAARAAMTDQGVALIEPTLFQRELQTGQLIRPFEMTATRGHAYWLVCLESKRLSPKIAAFRKWLQNELRAAAS